MSKLEMKGINFTEYSEFGYIVLKNLLQPADIEYLRSILSPLYEDSKRIDSDVKIRCYDDYPYTICGGVNVATIEDFSSKLPSRVFDILKNLEIVELAQELIQRNPISLKLFRAHVSGKFSYEGPWHRDQRLDLDDSDILCNVYIYDESGMRFFDKTSPLHADSSVYFGNHIESTDYKVLSVNAGDVVFFDPKIIHKPYSNEKRLHLHFRFTATSSDVTDFSNYKDNRLYYQRDRGLLPGFRRLMRFLKRVCYGNSEKNY